MGDLFDKFGIDPSQDSGSTKEPDLLDKFGIAPPEPEHSSLLRRAADIPVGLAKGIVDLGSAAVGLVDIPTNGAVGKAVDAVAEPLGEAADKIGLPKWARPTQWSQELGDLYSPETKQAKQNVSEAFHRGEQQAEVQGGGTIDKFLGGAAEGVPAMLENPSAAVALIAENYGGMKAISKATAKMLAPLAAKYGEAVKAGTMTQAEADRLVGNAAGRYAAVNEGLLTAGQNTAQVERENPDATFADRMMQVAAGAITGGVSRGVSKIPGLGDVEANMAAREVGAATTAGGGGFLARATKGALSEGLLEEFPQSIQEQIWQNLATGKAWDAGLAEQGVSGLVAGAGMGGAMGALHAGASPAAPDGRSAPEAGAGPSAGFVGLDPARAARIADLEAFAAAPGGLSPAEAAELDALRTHAAIDPDAGPLSKAASQAQAGVVEAAQQATRDEAQANFADRLGAVNARMDGDTLRAIRGAEGYGPESVAELLRTHGLARNPNTDPRTREQALAGLESFWQTFDNRPNFTMGGRPSAPGTDIAPTSDQGRAVDAARQGMPPFDPNTLQGEAREVADTTALSGPNPNRIAAPSVRALPTDAALAAKRDADAAYEQAFQDLVKAEQLGESDRELAARQQAVREAQTARSQAEERLTEIKRNIESGRAKQSAESRRAVLDAVLADPETVDPAGRFAAELRRQGFRDTAPTEAERAAIDRFHAVRGTFAGVDGGVIPSAPNELDAAALGIRERAPKPSQSARTQKRMPAPIATLEAAQRVAANMSRAGTPYVAAPHPVARGRFAVVPAAEADIRKSGSDDLETPVPQAAPALGPIGKPPAQELESAGPGNVKPQAVASDLAGEKLNRAWTAFAPESGTLGIPRAEMPQVQAEHRGALVNFMNARGVAHQQEEVAAASLKPTQAEFSPAKVKKAKEFAGGDRSILVSADGHVLDGHHQWLAKREAGEPINIIRLDAPIDRLLRLAHAFPSSTTAKGAAQAPGRGTAERSTQGAQADVPRALSLLLKATDGNGDPSGINGPENLGLRTEIVAALTGRDVAELEADPRHRFLTSIAQVERLLHEAVGIQGESLRERRAAFMDWIDRQAEQSAPQQFEAEAQDDPTGFVHAPDGSIDFGEITPEMAQAMRRQPGKIRLQQGVQNADGSGYGLAHIEARHGKQIRALGFDSIPEFVAKVASDFTEVWQAGGRQLLVTVKNGRKDVMYVQLEAAEDGDFYRVNSAFPVRQRDYEERHKMKKLWPESEPRAKASGEPPAFAAERADKASGTDPNAITQSDASVARALAAGNSSQDATADVGADLFYNRRNRTGRALAWSDVAGLNDTLKVKEVVKAKVWPRPNYEQLVADGMPPMMARFLKQVYDGVAIKPDGPSDEQLQRYIDVVGRVREAAFDLAREPRFAAGGPETSALLQAVWPEEMGRASLDRFRRGTEAWKDAMALGGNKALRKLQVDSRDLRKWREEIATGWPAKQESWQKQGYRILAPGSYTVESSPDAAYNRDTRSTEPTGEIRYLVRQSAGRGAWARVGDPFSGDKFVLVQDGGSFVREFDTEAAAVEAAREQVKKQRGNAGQDLRGMNIGEASRSGPHRREADENVSSERLMQTFGLRGVNFGRKGYINDAERQAYLNHAYDGLMDLADVLGVPPRALSLDGMLGIAFGAQGSGGFAAAHFVPGVNEINLTKTKGAGTLAHEWGHALDHYFANLAGLEKDGEPFLSAHADKPETRKTFASGQGQREEPRFAETIRQEMLRAFRAVRETMDSRPATPAELEQAARRAEERSRTRLAGWIAHFREMLGGKATAEQRAEFEQLASLLQRGDQGEGYVKSGNLELPPHVAAMRNMVKDISGRLPEVDLINGLAANALVVANLGAEREARADHIDQVPTDYAKESRAKDSAKRGKSYWATPWEMFARAFELYVHDKLVQRSQHNTFLSDAGLRAEMRDEIEGSGGKPISNYSMPYPRGAEREALDAAFDDLMRQLKTRETDRGVALFSRAASGAEAEDENVQRSTGRRRGKSITPDQIRAAFRLALPSHLDALDAMLKRGEEGKKGGLVIIDTADPRGIASAFASKTGITVERAMASMGNEQSDDAGRIQAFYHGGSGLTFLVGPNVRPEVAPAVILHEVTHSQRMRDLDARVLDLISRRATIPMRKEVRGFLGQVADRMESAGEGGNPAEATAYLVEEAIMRGRDAGFSAVDSRLLDWIDVTFSKRIGDIIRNFVAMVRAWGLRHGAPIKNMAVDDLVAFAQLGMRRAADGRVVMDQDALSASRAAGSETADTTRPADEHRMTEADLKDAIRRRMPGLARAVDTMLERGRRGEQGGAVLIDSADHEAIARVFAEKTGRALDDIAEALRLSKRRVQSINEVVRQAHGEPRKVAETKMGAVSSELAELVRQTTGRGLAGYEHAIDSDAVKHALAEHADSRKEQARGQVAVTDDDIRSAPAVIFESDRYVIGAKDRRGNDLIGYVKAMPDGTVLYIEEVRTGRKTLAFKSIRKYPAASNVDAVARTLALNARSDGGDAKIVTPAGASVNRSENGAIQGFYDPASGLTFLVGPHLTAETAPAVLLHEVTHSQQRAELDARAQALLDGRGRMPMHRDTRAFLDRVAARMGAAGETGNAQEATAYIVEQAVLEGRQQGFSAADGRFMGWVDSTLGKRVGNLIRSLVMQVRGWAARRGIKLGQLHVDDLVAFAQAGVKRAARGDVVTDGTARGNMPSMSDRSHVASEQAPNPAGGGKRGGQRSLDTMSDYEIDRYVLDPIRERISAISSEYKGLPEQDAEFDRLEAEEKRLSEYKRQRKKASALRPTNEELSAPYGSPSEIPAHVRQWVRRNASTLTSDASDAVRWMRIADTLRDERYPSGDLVIYRAVEGDEIRPGDWVTTDRAYAEEHLRRYLRGSGRIVEMIVDGRDVLTSPTGNGEEAIYAPREFSGPLTNDPSASAGSGASVRFSRAAAMPDWLTQMPQATQDAARKAGLWAEPKTLRERLKGLTDNAMKRLQQGLVDQFAPLKELGEREYVLARLTKSADAPIEALLLYGKPFLNAAGAIDVNLDKGGLIGELQKLDGEHDRFFAWMAGNRAEQLKKEGRENLFTDTDITALKDLNQGMMADGRSRAAAYHAARMQFNAYGKAVLDIAEKAGIINGADRAIWEKDFYVPFYRAMEDAEYKGPKNASGLVNQYAFKKLKGGTENLNDLMQNTLLNWSHLISASLKNQAAAAAIEAAEKAGAATPVGQKQKGSVSYLGKVVRKIPKGQTYFDGGVQKVSDGSAEVEEVGEKHYLVEDPFILDAITSLEWAGWNNPAMKWMQKAKHWLTIGVTVSPTFKIRNLIRDQISAIGQNPVSYNLLKNLAQGWEGTGKDSGQYARMLAGGGLMRFGTFLEDDRAAHLKRLIADGVKTGTILDSPAKVKAAFAKAWDWWQEVGDRSENITRAAIYRQRYEQFVAEGKSADEAHLLASYAARDSMDFSLQGQWGSIRFLTQLVPFLNARLQGLYKLGREGVSPTVRLLAGKEEVGDRERAIRFGAVTGAVALASMLLFLAYRDDDDWKRREEWDRDAYWWFKLPGGETAFRVPKPFEIGAIGTLAERGLETALAGFDPESRRIFADRMLSMLTQTFAMNPVPQLVKPMIDLYANTDSFTGRPIETMGMERLSKAERIGPNTSATAQLVGKATSLVGLSPVQVDHLIDAYFSWLGTHLVMTADFALRPMMGLSGRPAMKGPDDYFVVGDFVKSLPSRQSKYVTQFYEQAKAVQEVMADIRYYQSLGQTEKAREIAAENRDKVALYRLYSHRSQQLAEIGKRVRRVQMSDLSAEAKREEIDRLNAIRNRLAETTEARRVALQ